MIGDGAPLNPGAAQARSWAEHELSKPKYADHSSWLDQGMSWLEDKVLRMVDTLGRGGSGGLVVAVALLLAALVVWRVVQARRPGRRSRSRGDVSSVVDPSVTSGQLRARAQAAAERQDFDAAALDWFRTLVRTGQERGQLPGGEWLTSHDVTRLLTAAFPGHGPELAWAAGVFDLVRYGHGHAGPADADRLRALEAQLRSERALTPAPA